VARGMRWDRVRREPVDWYYSRPKPLDNPEHPMWVAKRRALSWRLRPKPWRGIADPRCTEAFELRYGKLVRYLKSPR
jgi:hypothetical protein